MEIERLSINKGNVMTLIHSKEEKDVQAMTLLSPTLLKKVPLSAPSATNNSSAEK
jgi:hypothetical protein